MAFKKYANHFTLSNTAGLFFGPNWFGDLKIYGGEELGELHNGRRLDLWLDGTKCFNLGLKQEML